MIKQGREEEGQWIDSHLDLSVCVCVWVEEEDSKCLFWKKKKKACDGLDYFLIGLGF